MYSSYCHNEKTSWANINDLYDRYGEEFVDKLSIRRKWDEDLGEYIADENKASMTRVQSIALCDARSLIMSLLSQKYSNLSVLDNDNFRGIKHWHIKFTIDLLKQGGDCQGCKEGFLEFLEQNQVCSESGCLDRKRTFISATKAEFKCEPRGNCCGK